ncbi:flagellar hook protein FlgE [Sulfurospirillum sp. 1612]|uniref:flagellar hook protein FlgE n=1 Tax=Sulfurospirillum sp. 1612 TaxID=3094835 RepID=UPI002F91C540
MNTSFYNGLSGLNSFQSGVDVLADNIANVNTVGFKGSSAEFSTVFSKALSSNGMEVSNEIGMGSTLDATALDTSQGALQTTDNVFDLALNSEGWFGVQNSSNQINYTRSGSFDVDASGYLTDASGNYLLGTLGNNITPTTLDQATRDAYGSTLGDSSLSLADAYAISNIDDIPLGSVSSQSKIQLPDLLYFPASPTTNVSYHANLDPTITLDNLGQEIPNVEHFSSTVISPSGENGTLDMTFTKRVPQPTTGTTWDADIKILGPAQTYDATSTYDPTQYDIDAAAKKVYPIVDSKTGVLTFDSDGKLSSSTVPVLSNGGVPLTLDLGAVGTYDGLFSSADFSTGSSEKHDGYEDGLLKDYGMDNNGNVVAEFTNGKSIPIAKIAVYHFQNDQGLEQVGNSLFSASQNSGNPIFYTDSSGKPILGSQISSKKLESSNVSLSTALTELIVMQKAFDASSKSITTSDELIQNAINMKK